MTEFVPPDDWYSDDDAPEEFEGRDSLLSQIADELGLDSIREVIVDLENLPFDVDLRPITFPTLEDAVLYLYDIGVLEFAFVVDLGEDGFVVGVGDSPGVFSPG